MGSKEKFFSITSAEHGTDNLGLAQPTGNITAIGDAKNISSKWAGKLAITVNTILNLSKGMPIRIYNLDSGHNGLTYIKEIVTLSGPVYKIITNIPYNNSLVDGTGNFAIDGGAGSWDAFMPIGADLPAANVAFTLWDSDRQGGNESASNYTQNKVYVFPGVIKTIQISTAGNVVLFRSATRMPWGKDAQ